MNRTQLITAHLPLVDYIARCVQKKIPPFIELDDLVQAGRMGLVDAVDKYDPQRNVQPKTYFAWRIRGSIMDYLREQSWLPRGVTDRRRKINDAQERLRNTYGREPMLEEIQVELGLTDEVFDEWMRDASCTIVSFEFMKDFDHDDEWTNGFDMIEMIPSDAPTPEMNAEHAEISAYLQQILFLLDDNERTVVELYYFEGRTMREIGEHMGVTESRVSQIHTKVLSRLRRLINRDKLLG